MTNNPAKIQKRIAKKKGSINSLHENSRDSKRLRRACARADKLEKLSASRAKAREPFRRSHMEY